MTTLYEHKLFGSKISMVSAIFNIPFLTGEGSICLYESGIILYDEEGNEKYTIQLNEFNIEYDKFVNIRNLRYVTNVKFITQKLNKKYMYYCYKYKKVKGNYYGKLIITIPNIGCITLFDNQSFKYERFYLQIVSVKQGHNPLKIKKSSMKKSVIKFLKHKIFSK